MPRKKDKKKRDSSQTRPPRPKPIIDFTIDKLEYRNTELLQTFVTGHGRILPRKYTGLPAHYQRRMANAIKRARTLLLMKSPTFKPPRPKRARRFFVPTNANGLQ